MMTFRKNAKCPEAKPERLDRLQRETRHIREAYVRGEISDLERLKRLNELRQPKSFCERLLRRIFSI